MRLSVAVLLLESVRIAFSRNVRCSTRVYNRFDQSIDRSILSFLSMENVGQRCAFTAKKRGREPIYKGERKDGERRVSGPRRATTV